MDSNEDFWSCFLILWDPGNPPSFCKHVSSSLRSLSSSSRRSLSSCENMSETGDSTKSCDHARQHSASFMHANNHIPYILMCTSLEAPLWLKYVKISCLILHYFTPPACSMESSKLTSPLGNLHDTSSIPMSSSTKWAMIKIHTIHSGQTMSSQHELRDAMGYCGY